MEGEGRKGRGEWGGLEVGRGEAEGVRGTEGGKKGVGLRAGWHAVHPHDFDRPLELRLLVANTLLLVQRGKAATKGEVWEEWAEGSRGEGRLHRKEGL